MYNAGGRCITAAKMKIHSAYVGKFRRDDYGCEIDGCSNWQPKNKTVEHLLGICTGKGAGMRMSPMALETLALGVTLS